MGTYSTASSTNKCFLSINQAKPQDGLARGYQRGSCSKSKHWGSGRGTQRRTPHQWGAIEQSYTVPNLPNDVLLPSIRGLFEVVRVKDAEL